MVLFLRCFPLNPPSPTSTWLMEMSYFLERNHSLLIFEYKHLWLSIKRYGNRPWKCSTVLKLLTQTSIDSPTLFFYIRKHQLRSIYAFPLLGFPPPPLLKTQKRVYVWPCLYFFLKWKYPSDMRCEMAGGGGGERVQKLWILKSWFWTPLPFLLYNILKRATLLLSCFPSSKMRWTCKRKHPSTL